MLKIENISKDWGNFKLNNISLELKKGEYFVLLGPCGAGKTLLLETIAGFWKPDSGKLFLSENDITQSPPEKRQIGFVYQEYFLFPNLSVMENILYGLKARKKLTDHKNKVEELILLLDMKEIVTRKNIMQLSGGERQKVALARVLIWEPELLLLDEPLHSLDYTSRDKVFKYLKLLNNKFNNTVIHVTHDHTEAKEIAQRVGIINNGTIIESGPMKKVLTNFEKQFNKGFPGYAL